MAVPTNTAQTYGFTTIREDIADVVDRISPTETPVYTAIKRGTAKSTYKEWAVEQLAAANEDNKTIEGDDAVIDAPNVATRYGNYTQLMDKVASVSDTAERVDSVGNTTSMAHQVLLKGLEIKRDMEKRITSNEPAVAGGASTARETAGIGAFLITNTDRGAGGADPELSGTTSGYPDTGPVAGTPRAFTETQLKDVIQLAWDQGGEPQLAVTGGYNRRVFSGFTGNATKTIEVGTTKKLNTSINVYASDFGDVKIVADRFAVTSQVLVLDTDKVAVDWLQKMRNEPLAKTGHSDKRMITAEFLVRVDNEKAHAVIADLTTSA